MNLQVGERGKVVRHAMGREEKDSPAYVTGFCLVGVGTGIALAGGVIAAASTAEIT